MSTPTVFLYNLDNPRGAKIRRLCMPLGLRTGLVSKDAYGQPLGELAAGRQPETPYAGEGFDDEMMVLSDCPGRLLELLLQSFRRNKGAPVHLKAVLTPTNREGDSVALHAALCRELEAIRAGQAAAHPQKPL